MAPPSSLAWKLTLLFGMLGTGAINTLSKKIQNQCAAVGIDGKKEAFSKPWSQTLVMFSGEACLIFVFFMQQALQRRADAALVNAGQSHPSSVQVSVDSSINNSMGPMTPSYSQSVNAIEEDELRKPLLAASQPPAVGQAKGEAPTWKTYCLLIVPTCLDLLGTTFAGIGLLYAPASVFQMLRGSIVVFTFFLSMIILKQKKQPYQYFGVFVTFIGLIVVGTSSLLNPGQTSTSSKLVLGLLLIVAGQFCGALQMVFEEKQLKGRYHLSPAQIVGTEGCWGVIIMAGIVLPSMYFAPGNDHGSYENALDAVTQIGNNNLLKAMVLLYWCSISFYNFFGLSVANEFSSVHRTLIDASRTVFVWGIDLFIYYKIDSDYGETWTTYSPMQLGGFLLLITGVFAYNRVFKVPGFRYT